MRFILPAFAAVFLIVGTQAACAWSYQGHEVVGAIADHLLTPNAAQKVREIAGVNLQAASKWADCVKGVVQTDDGRFTYRPDPEYRASCREFETTDSIARMEDYVRRNTANCRRGADDEACHRQYHYADVAIQHSSYDRSLSGASDHDIVSSTSAAITLLRENYAPAPFSIRDRKEALLMLAHFVGDIHQPLHVGAAYIDSNDRLMNPDIPGLRADPHTQTRGGNWLFDGTSNLHSLWDALPPFLRSGKISERTLHEARATGTSPSDIPSWPATWATESLMAARSAYGGITFRREPGGEARWAVRFDDRAAYTRAKNRIQMEQLTKAGARLAQVLNSIWP